MSKMDQIIKYFLKNDQISLEVLYSIGYSDNDINNLVNDNVIKSNDEGLFFLVGTKKLEDYSKKYFYHKEYALAEQFLKKCYSINPSSEVINLRMFYFYIMEENYSEALKTFEVFSKDKVYDNDNKIYLFLLNYIIDLPSELQEVIKQISANDILIVGNDKRLKEREILNKARELILKCRFDKAICEFNKMKSSSSRAVSTVITKKLAILAQKKAMDEIALINELIFTGKFQEVADLLLQKKEKRCLSYEQDVLFQQITALISDVSLETFSPETEKADKLFNEQKYLNAVDAYLYKIDKYKPVSAAVYYKISLCYSYLNNLSLAYIFCLVAIIRNNNANDLKKYEELRDSLIERYNNQTKSSSKSRGGFEENSNEESVPHFKEIIEAVLEFDIDFNFICAIYKLTPYQKLFAKIGLAKELYGRKKFSEADKLLIEVEKNCLNDYKTYALISEARKNKQFYQYRDCIILERKKDNN